MDQLKPPESSEAEASDGRRRRSERSRRQIVEALFKLVRSGEMNPSAAQVAEAANVSLRTVFRHFEEMDSLYQEMSREMDGIILPQVNAPLQAKDWKGRLRELMERRTKIFEDIMPLRLCGMLRRYQSDFLMGGHKRFLEFEAAAVDRLLPESIRTLAPIALALDSALSFDVYRRLRQDRGLTQAKAKAVVAEMLEAILRPLPS